MKDQYKIYYVSDNLAVLNCAAPSPLEDFRLGQQIVLLHIASLGTNSAL